MEIVEYNEVDPLEVMYLNQLALDFALTPEKVVRIRASDPRPFPCLAIYAIEKGTVLGQVGIFRLPMISTEGREDVGGIWAVSTHPQYAGRGVASLLIEEAHRRMREAGLRFSTLGTNRYRLAYKLYRQHGYEETDIWATALAPWELAHQPTRLRAEKPAQGDYDFVEQIYQRIAKHFLGFAWRNISLSELGQVKLDDIWIMYENRAIVGYAIANINQSTLSISNLLLQPGIDAAESVAAVAAEVKSEYVRVAISRPTEYASLRRAGYHVAHPDWSAFMVKSLNPELTVEDARQLFGIGTDNFLISRMDIT